MSSFSGKPKVWVNADGKRKKCRVLSVTNDTVACEFPGRVDTGTYSLFLTPKGERTDIEVTDSFTIEGPTFSKFSLSSGENGDEITLVGKYFGARKPKLWMTFEGEKRCGTKSVKKNCKISKPLPYSDAKGKSGKSCMDVETGDGKIVFTVPKKVTENTVCTLNFDNKTGSFTANFNSNGGGAAGSYLIVDLTNGSVTEQDSAPYDLLTNDDYKTTKLVLRKIKAGTFTMGSPSDETGRYSNEDQRQVTLTDDFHIGVFELTQKQYEIVMGSNPSWHTGDKHPVESVSWDSARGGTYPSGDPGSDSFMGKLRTLTGGSYMFDLPTEAQWEYACRATTTKAYNDYTKNDGAGADCLTSEWQQDTNLDPLAWYRYNCFSQKHHQEVGTKQTNYWGLYDMHGNIREWCLDWYTDSLGTLAVIDPVGASSGSYRCERGGSWYDYARDCRSAYRYYYNPSFDNYGVGIRVVLPAGK